MSRIEIPEEYEGIIDALMVAKEELDGLAPSRHHALARTHVQDALHWLLANAVADALEADGLEEAEEGDAGDVGVHEGTDPNAS
jgi:hypothetical protein